MLRAICAWGIGPDIMLCIEDYPVIIYEEPINKDRFTHGTVSNGSSDLTLTQAKELVQSLNAAIKECEQIEASVQNYFNERSLSESPN